MFQTTNQSLITINQHHKPSLTIINHHPNSFPCSSHHQPDSNLIIEGGRATHAARCSPQPGLGFPRFALPASATLFATGHHY